MKNSTRFDVIIMGGSYAGLSAGMALGRSLRKVLIIDSGQPCNKQTPHSHNFITQDGETPKAIAEKAKQQLLKYDTVSFYNGLAVASIITKEGFEVKTEKGESFLSRKLLFATGIVDLVNIPGAADCWGISVLHCPYCHGYEVRNQELAVVGNGNIGFDFVKMIHHWSKQTTLFTNGKSTFTDDQVEMLKKHNINIIEDEITAFEHTGDKIKCVVLNSKQKINVDAVFARFGFIQHCRIPQQLGCELNEQGYIVVDDFQRTTVPGVFAAGDNASPFRAVAAAIAAGNKAGAVINRDLIDEEFNYQTLEVVELGTQGHT